MSNEDNYNDAKLDRHLDEQAEADRTTRETIKILKSELEDIADALEGMPKDLVLELDDMNILKEFRELVEAVMVLHDKL